MTNKSAGRANEASTLEVIHQKQILKMLLDQEGPKGLE